MLNFENLGLPEKLLKTVKEKKFEKPSEIQSKSIPEILKGKDVIGKSSTGSGKTLCYISGILSECKENENTVQAIILSPTRELSKQIYEEIMFFSKYFSFKISLINGGGNINSDYEKIKDSQIIVGTPGRILDHLKKGSLNLDSIKIFVLDEADIMIDKEFIDEISEILEFCNEERQDLMFSATFSKEIENLAKTYMKDPVYIKAKEKSVKEDKLLQFIYRIPSNEKLSLLIYFLNNYPSTQNIVFVNRSETAKIIKKNVKRFTPLDCEVLHADIPNGRRKKILEEFKDGKFDILITTDIASRGIDSQNISHIYNFNIPSDSKRYVHRIGRTARFGNEGKVINLLSDNDFKKFMEIVEEFKIKCKEKDLPNFEILKTLSLENKFDKKKKKN